MVNNTDQAGTGSIVSATHSRFKYYFTSHVIFTSSPWPGCVIIINGQQFNIGQDIEVNNWPNFTLIKFIQQ